MANPPKILIVAGELSGDYHASHLVKEIRRIRPEAEIFGFGSHRMQEAGVRLVADTADWGGIGVFDNLFKIGKTSAGYRLFQKTLMDEKPDVFVPVDFRFFNLRAATFARAHGVPSVYYFAPVSWDLGKNRPIFITALRRVRRVQNEANGSTAAIPTRYRQVAEAVDFALVTFKFAVPFYQRTGMKFEYIGHPLAEILDSEHSGPPSAEVYGKPTLALLPGSREMEIKRHLFVLVAAARTLRKEFPNYRYFVSVASPALKPLVESCIPESDREWLTLYEGDGAMLLWSSTLALVCSGTAVHQGMILGTPMIAFYKVNPVLGLISRLFIFNLPYYAFPNVIAGREVIPELIQEQFTADNLSRLARELLVDDERSHVIRTNLLHLAAGEHVAGGIHRAAEVICSYLPK